MGQTKQLRSLLAPFPELTLKGSRGVNITGICSHSKRIAPGNLFIARKGTSHDGTQFIADALRAGAVAIASDLYNPSLKVPQVLSGDLQSLEGRLADTFYGHPSQKMTTIGITGTSGKTSTSYLIRHLLEGLGIACGLIGTVETSTGRERRPASLTTPDPSTLHNLLWEMQQHKCKAALLEATSHGLLQGRLEGVRFEIALFTNLSHEHLDYHGTMEAYAKAKSKLFPGVPKAALNGDDPWHHKMAGAAKSLLYGLQPHFDLYATEITPSAQGTRFTVHYKGDSADVMLPLIGTFNVYNALAALSALLLQGYPLSKLTPLLPSFPGVPGRLERIPNERNLTIYVDFAHKPEALRAVLQTVRPLTKGKLITVIGCGGDRDREKRPLMGQIARSLSDIPIFTSDNPRSEDPLAICREMGGLSHEIIVDRRSAIAHAVELAAPEDLILIAGRGHEAHQIIAGQLTPFDDRTVAQEVCQ